MKRQRCPPGTHELLRRSPEAWRRSVAGVYPGKVGGADAEIGHCVDCTGLVARPVPAAPAVRLVASGPRAVAPRAATSSTAWVAIAIASGAAAALLITLLCR